MNLVEINAEWESEMENDRRINKQVEDKKKYNQERYYGLFEYVNIDFDRYIDSTIKDFVVSSELLDYTGFKDDTEYTYSTFIDILHFLMDEKSKPVIPYSCNNLETNIIIEDLLIRIYNLKEENRFNLMNLDMHTKLLFKKIINSLVERSYSFVEIRDGD